MDVGQPVSMDNSSLFMTTAWFRVLYAAVEFWYVEVYGPEAVRHRGVPPLEGVILIRGTPFALRFIAFRRVSANRTTTKLRASSS